jgi:hypothetical protein
MKKYRRRPRLTEAEKVTMWNRRHLVATGGIRPLQRRRSQLALTLAEREEISRGIVAGHSIRWIATELGRAAPQTL